MPKEEFQKWEGEWYGKYSTEPYVEFIKPGSVVVLDVEGDGDTGSVGSFNSLAWVSKGARGIISNGGIRDTAVVASGPAETKLSLLTSL
jgi:regulator of RNase E activity RraA